jgi:hypothetical protein
MATTCVFVTVSEGVKTLIRTVDVEVNQKHTFDELLDIVLELKDVALESFDERKVTVTMRATLSSPSVEIGKRTATVASRIGAGHFVAFNVAPPPPKPMARPEVAKADQAAARARSSYLLQAAGRALIARPEKHDVNNKLLSASLWFNGLVDSFEVRSALSTLSCHDGPNVGFRSRLCEGRRVQAGRLRVPLRARALSAAKPPRRPPFEAREDQLRAARRGDFPVHVPQGRSGFYEQPPGTLDRPHQIVGTRHFVRHEDGRLVQGPVVGVHGRRR